MRLPRPAGLHAVTQRRSAWMAAIVLGVIAAVYWPVHQGGFVWDDEIDFLKYDWLTRGDAWKHYVFRDFHGWTNYFRPLVVALFTLQLRLFDVAPGPMHLVSLGVHLANSLLVGALAHRLLRTVSSGVGTRPVAPTLAMLIYGLHPAQIEPVAWIASQFDLFATCFMLLGLNASAWLTASRGRNWAIATCFFFAACSKESAACFPLLLATIDWLLDRRRAAAGARDLGVAEFLKRNRSTYLAVLVAGLGYLAIRYWSLGVLNVPGPADGPSVFGRLNTASFLFWRYAAMLVAPTVGMGPLHPFDPAAFEVADAPAIATIASAVAALGVSVWFALRRRSPLACAVLAFAAGILPVLRLVSAPYENELYCSRYLMTSLAIVCAMLPLLVGQPLARVQRIRPLAPALLALLLAWVATSALTIRATLPLWSNSISLWRWALTVDPMSAKAANALLIAYADRGLTDEARALADEVIARRIKCFNCMITMVEVNLRDGDLVRAAASVTLAAAAGDDPAINPYMRQRLATLIAALNEQVRKGPR